MRLNALELPVKESPMLFSGPMVRALLEGRKTQTRRVVKPQPTKHPDPFRGDVGFTWPSSLAKSMVDVRDMRSLSPYGVVGDRLWVKETHRVLSWDGVGDASLHYEADGAERRFVRVLADDYDDWCERQAKKWMRAGAEYVTHDEDGDEVDAGADDDGEDCWYQMPKGKQPPSTPSIFMPRWASRITLEVTGVRVERLQAISGADALAEGVGRPLGTSLAYGCVTDAWNQREYSVLWEQINGAGSWAANPWVWVVEFAVAEVRR